MTQANMDQRSFSILGRFDVTMQDGHEQAVTRSLLLDEAPDGTWTLYTDVPSETVPGEVVAYGRLVVPSAVGEAMFDALLYPSLDRHTAES